MISADNKGYAAYRVEHDVHGVDWAHRGDFVAAFAQTTAGDMSPNLRGGGAQGPTDDEFENTRIIGRLQADRATQLFDGATETLAGPIDVRQRYVDFSGVDVSGASDAVAGTYRIVHRGNAKLFGTISSFTGTSRSFAVG